MNRPARAWRAICSALAIVAGAAALAQPATTYPNRPVRVVVPFGAGSGPDLRARQLGQKLSEQWGQPVIVDNRPGAGGQIGTEQGARAAPDGYTLTMAGQSTLAIAPHLTTLPFDPLKDLVPVAFTGVGAIVLVVNAELPVRSVAELVDYAKRNPGKLNAASWGPATITHLSLELFNRAAGVQIVHVPYKGGPSQYMPELLSGQVQLAFEFLPAIGGHVKSGRLSALAVSGRQRLAPLPDVPTFTEAGVPQMATVGGWQGVAVPAGTPREVVDRLHADVARVLALPEVRASYIDSGFDPGGGTPEEFAAFVRAEHARWGRLIGEAGIRAE